MEIRKTLTLSGFCVIVFLVLELAMQLVLNYHSNGWGIEKPAIWLLSIYTQVLVRWKLRKYAWGKGSYGLYIC